MIPRDEFDRYARALGACSDLAAAAAAQACDMLGDLSGAELYRELAKVYAALVAKYGAFAAAAAVEFYASTRGEASPAGGYEPGQFEPATAGGVLASDVDRALMSAAAAEALARSAVQRAMEYADATVAGNAAADPARPRWALVPHAGACDWCRMLGSRGFDYASARSVQSQRHPGCRCIPAPDFSASPGLDGYDPAALYDEYRERHPEWASRRGGSRGRARKVAEVFAGGHRFGSIGDIEVYLRGAATKEDLAERVKVADAAGKGLGFKPGSPYAKSLAQAAQSTAKRLAANSK